MPFKRRFSLPARKQIAVLFVTMLICIGLGCGLKIGEKPAPPSTPAFKGNFSCMAEISQHIDKYFQQQLSDEEISNFINCMKSSFISFSDLVKGRDDSSYAAEELRSFLHYNFIKDRKISDGLLHQMMVLKQVLFGGSAEQLTRAELAFAVEFLEEIRIEAIRLRPHVPLLNAKLSEGKLTGRKLQGEIDEMAVDLDKTVEVLNSRLSRSQRPYALSEMEQLLVEMGSFLKWQEVFKGGQTAKSWMDFLNAFKGITVATANPDKIEAREWKPLLVAVSQWFSVYVEFRLGLANQKYLRGEGLDTLNHFMNNVFGLVKKSFDKPSITAITVSQLAQVASKLKDLKVIPSHVRVCSIQFALKAFIERIFGGRDLPIKVDTAVGFTRSALLAIEDEFNRFISIQLGLYSDFQKQATESASLGLFADILFVSYLEPYPEAVSRHSVQNWLDFLRVRNIMRPLFPDEKHRVQLVPARQMLSHGLFHGFYNYTAMNVLHSVTRLMMLGYSSSEKSRIGWDSQLAMGDMQEFYKDFNEIGTDLGFVDSRTTDTGGRSFFEGNIFTYAADGFEDSSLPGKDRNLTFAENMQFISYMYSAGGLAGGAYNYLIGKCPLIGLDHRGNHKLDRACVIKELPGFMLTSEMSHMPGIQKFIASSTPAVVESYVRNMMATAYSKTLSAPDIIERSEITVFGGLVQYSESLMTRFDTDENEYLDRTELEIASPIFTGFVKKFAKQTVGQDLNTEEAVRIFISIVETKEVPSGPNAWWIKTFGESGELSIDRLELSQVFKVFISRLGEANPVMLREPSSPNCE